MVTSIANSLGYGSGIDIPKLVSDLAAASRNPKVARFDTRERAVQSSISAVAQAKADLDGFTSSLSALVAGGTLQTQPTVSDTTVLDAKTKTGARLGNFSGSVEVLQLARGQTSASAYVASATDPVGQGTLTLTVGSTATAITIGPANDSLNGVAAAINAANAGVTANVVTDTSGARLVLKGPTGSASSFGLTSADPGLSTLASGTAVVQTAQNASFNVDGLNYSRASNIVDDAIPGVVLTLKKVAVGAPVALGITRSSDTLKSTMRDFVSVYNELKGHVTAARTATRGDQALRLLDRQLGEMLTQAVSSGQPPSLSSIGIKTNRDGTIMFDEGAFNAAYAANPDGVEAIFVPTRDATHTATTDPGIGGALEAIKTALTGTNGPLTSLSTRLGKEAANISKDRSAMEEREATYKERLEKQFGNLDSKMGALKATQSYLTQQVQLWSKSN